MKYITFDATLQGHEATEENAIEMARGMVWSECEISQDSIGYGRHVATVEGIDVYYDYGADYYFFCPESPEDWGWNDETDCDHNWVHAYGSTVPYCSVCLFDPTAEAA